MLKKRLFDFHLIDRVSRNRIKRRGLVAAIVLSSASIGAVRRRHEHALVLAQVLKHHEDGVAVGRFGPDRVLVTERGPDIGGERDDDIRLLEERKNRGLAPHVSPDDRKFRVMTKMRK